MIRKDDSIFVAGHMGLAGDAITRALTSAGFNNLILEPRATLDLMNRGRVFDFFAAKKPKHVILAAAKVGGIGANAAHPVAFLSENLQIQTNVLDAALLHSVERLVFLGSSCIYPRLAPQPMTEDSLLTGPLEPTNDAYAIAKIAGVRHVKAVFQEHGRPWFSVMPTNLFGERDRFGDPSSHFIPAMIYRYWSATQSGANEVENWGTGTPRREVMYADDFASALTFLLRVYEGSDPINIGTGSDHAISEIAEEISRLVGFQGTTIWDPTHPDGAPRKLLDVTKLTELGWASDWPLTQGLKKTIDGFLRNTHTLQGRNV